LLRSRGEKEFGNGARRTREFPEREREKEETSFPFLVQTLAGTHGALDVKRADVLPVLLQQRHQEVDGQTDVGSQVIRLHGNVADSHGQAQDLLELKLDGGFQLLDLGDHVVSVSDHRREFTGLVQPGTQDTRDLLDERVGSQESVVFLGELFDQLLVLVHLLQGLLVHAGNTVGRGFIAMLLITKNANGELGPRNMTQLHGTRETLLLLRIVVLQVDLEFDGLQELSVLFLGLLQDSVDALQNRVTAHFAHFHVLQKPKRLEKKSLKFLKTTTLNK